MIFYSYEPIAPGESRPERQVITSWANQPGFLLISADGSAPTVAGYTEGGSTTIGGDFDLVEIEQLEDLSLDQLNQAVDFLDVDTAAQTAAGLRRAIERHLEEAGQ